MSHAVAPERNAPGQPPKMGGMNLPQNILEMRNIRKEFPGVVALDNVDFVVKQGEIHALVGENGAGKSTLMKILGGVYPADTYQGEIIIDGQAEAFQSIKDSEKAGVAVIYQELTLVKYMSVCENLFLGNEVVDHGLIDWDAAFLRAKGVLEEIQLDVNPAAQVIHLGMGTQQLIEIGKAVGKKARILVLDEPTSSLTEQETENLLQLLRTFRERGVTCIFISHKLKEVFEIADTITVLYDGRTVGTYPAAELTEDRLISLMVGREMTQRYPTATHTPGEVALEVRNWSAYDQEITDKMALHDISFASRKGEILGVSGLMGAGRTELILSILGVWGKKAAGEVFLFGEPVSAKSPSDMIRVGIGYLSEDRKGKGLILIQDVKSNMALASLMSRVKNGLIDEDAELRATEEMVKALRVKTPSLEQIVQNLSGGNQQKVSLGKWLLTNPKVLILDEPTRGIDVGAKYEIYTIMHQLVEMGISIIMISSELPEILGMSDRILVMCEGKIAAELSREEATSEKIMTYATGGM